MVLAAIFYVAGLVFIFVREDGYGAGIPGVFISWLGIGLWLATSVVV